MADHHSVYVVYLRDPKGDGRAAYYVGMTGLTPEQRFENHKAGIKAARVVKKFGVRLVPKLYAHLNPMPYEKAVEMEACSRRVSAGAATWCTADTERVRFWFGGLRG